MNIIEINNLTKVYRTEELETTALNKINLTVKKGEFVAIMGASGCGKSTLLNVLGLLDNPESGSYKLMNNETINLSNKNKSKLRTTEIGFVFQNFNLIDELTVAENVELPLLYAKVPKSERNQRVSEILEKIGIAHRANHFPQQLSGGQQQRVAVSRALVTKPNLILADEPTGNLDSTHGNEVMNLLTDLHEQGTSIVMVTHSNHDASFANRIINLMDGEIVSEKINRTMQSIV